MEIILLENVVNLGKLGEIKVVKNGYARNYLIPTAKAQRATTKNIAEFEILRAEYLRKQNDVLAMAQDKFNKINEQLFTISAKAGVDGKLFGSITTFDIVDLLANNEIEIKRTNVILSNGHLKTLGLFEVTIALHHDVYAKIKINVVAES